MADKSEKPIMRAVFLPADLEERLRMSAFRNKKSQSFILGKAIEQLKVEHVNAENQLNNIAKPEIQTKLRTFDISTKMDDKLKEISFKTNMPKGDVLKIAISSNLDSYAKFTQSKGRSVIRKKT